MRDFYRCRESGWFFSRFTLYGWQQKNRIANLWLWFDEWAAHRIMQSYPPSQAGQISVYCLNCYCWFLGNQEEWAVFYEEQHLYLFWMYKGPLNSSQYAQARSFEGDSEDRNSRLASLCLLSQLCIPSSPLRSPALGLKIRCLWNNFKGLVPS